jgi:hypothetical protein
MAEFSDRRDYAGFANIGSLLMKELRLLCLSLALATFAACQRQTEEQKNPECDRDVRQQLVSPSPSPQNPYGLKSQAQRFQPRRVVPMAPMAQTPTPTPRPSPFER